MKFGAIQIFQIFRRDDFQKMHSLLEEYQNISYNSKRKSSSQLHREVDFVVSNNFLLEIAGHDTLKLEKNRNYNILTD